MDTADVLMLAILLGVYWNQHMGTSIPKGIAADPLQLQVLFNVLIVHTETALKYGGESLPKRVL